MNLCVVSIMYCSQRSQWVNYRGALSFFATLTHDIPPEQRAGPTFFKIFINGLLSSLPNNSSIAYFDSVTLINQSNNAIGGSNKMQMLLNILCLWSLNNKLSISTAKCFSMIISPQVAKCKQPFSLLLRLGSANIIQSNTIKILGVTLNDNLGWTTQSKYMQSVVNNII